MAKKIGWGATFTRSRDPNYKPKQYLHRAASLQASCIAPRRKRFVGTLERLCSCMPVLKSPAGRGPSVAEPTKRATMIFYSRQRIQLRAVILSKHEIIPSRRIDAEPPRRDYQHGDKPTPLIITSSSRMLHNLSNSQASRRKRSRYKRYRTGSDSAVVQRTDLMITRECCRMQSCVIDHSSTCKYF